MAVCQNSPVFGNEKSRARRRRFFPAPTLWSELRLSPTFWSGFNVGVVVAVKSLASAVITLTTAKDASFLTFTRFSSLEKITVFSLTGTSLGTSFSTTLLMVWVTGWGA